MADGLGFDVDAFLALLDETRLPTRLLLAVVGFLTTRTPTYLRLRTTRAVT